MSYPDTFWHCSIRLHGGKEHTVVNDLSFADLKRQIINPWFQGVAFPVSGLIVRSRDQVVHICITHTPYPLQWYVAQDRERDRNSSVVLIGGDDRSLAISSGVDYTPQLLFASLDASIPEPEVGLVLRLCKRLPASARILAMRRKGKVAFQICDEYDAQDLLNAVLRAYLKYSVHEEPLGKIGGGHSGRVDVAIEELGTVVELKYVHGPDDQRRIVDEYSNDLLLYTKWPHLKHFIYLVYNSQDLRDPEALEKLGGPITINGVAFTAHVVLA